MNDTRFMFTLVALAVIMVTFVASAAPSGHVRHAETTTVVPVESGFTFELPTTSVITLTAPPKAKVTVTARHHVTAKVKQFVCDGVWHDSKYDEQKYQRCEWL